MKVEREKLIRFLEGSLPESERSELESRLQVDDELTRQLAQVQSMRASLEAARPESFAPFFSDRVMKRLKGDTAPETDSMYDALRWVFVRAAFACLLVAIAVGSYNIVNYQELEIAGSFVEALFGLPADSLPDALAYGSL